RSLDIVGIPRRDAGHRVAVRANPIRLRTLLEAVEQPRGRIDVCALALGRLNCRGASDGVVSLLELRGRLDPRRERIAPSTERDSPVRNCARRIGGKHGIESVDCLAEVERMEQRHRAIEWVVDTRLARRREPYCAKLFAGGDAVLMFLSSG